MNEEQIIRKKNIIFLVLETRLIRWPMLHAPCHGQWSKNMQKVLWDKQTNKQGKYHK
jgi:hypothetical protein